MKRIEEYNKLLEYITQLEENGIKMDVCGLFTADIAKSLAIIADKLTEGEETKWELSNFFVYTKKSI